MSFTSPSPFLLSWAMSFIRLGCEPNCIGRCPLLVQVMSLLFVMMSFNRSSSLVYKFLYMSFTYIHILIIFIYIKHRNVIYFNILIVHIYSIYVYTAILKIVTMILNAPMYYVNNVI